MTFHLDAYRKHINEKSLIASRGGSHTGRQDHSVEVCGIEERPGSVSFITEVDQMNPPDLTMGQELNDGTRQVLCSASFSVRGKTCLVQITTKSIIWTPISEPSRKSQIHFDKVISVRPCFCRKPVKNKISCPCVDEDLSLASSSNSTSTSGFVDTVSSSSSTDESPPNSSSDSGVVGGTRSTSGTTSIRLIRVFFATPVGKYGYKPTFISLVPSGGLKSTSIHSNDNSSLEGVDSVQELVICEWINIARAQIEALNRPKRILIFINPFGGKRMAERIYQERVYPLMRLAAIETDFVLTERANHARDTILDPTFSLSKYSGVICVGGDGMFAEILNGLVTRVNQDSGIDVNSAEAELVVPNLTLGVIPAGSTDAVAFGTTGINDPVTSTLHVIFGHRVNLDISAIHSTNDRRLIRYATSFLAYGYFGDLLAESEEHRWMGPSRYDWAALKKFMKHRLYEGEVKLWLSNRDSSPSDPHPCLMGCQMCHQASVDKHSHDRQPSETRKRAHMSSISIKGRFIGINAATMACRCAKAKKGISPSAHLGDGCTDLILVSDCSRMKYLQYLIRTGFSTKSPFDLGFVDVYRVRGFEFIPAIDISTTSSSNRYQVNDSSVWNCDGEIITEAAIRVQVHCQLVSVFGTGVELRSISPGSRRRTPTFGTLKKSKSEADNSRSFDETSLSPNGMDLPRSASMLISPSHISRCSINIDRNEQQTDPNIPQFVN